MLPPRGPLQKRPPAGCRAAPIGPIPGRDGAVPPIAASITPTRAEL